MTLEKIYQPEDIKKLSLPELKSLAGDIRYRIIDCVMKNGGHLASSLGAVELAIALHYVYDSPKDKLIWDVGHQAYAHKILTGRNQEFSTLRTYKGISGFLKRTESPHDIFGAGHASTSISAALGAACLRDIEGGDETIVSIIGDGSLTGGMAFEALNHAGQLKKNKFVVILNDNRMSISKNVGAMSSYLSRLHVAPAYYRLKEDVEYLLNKIPNVGYTLVKILKQMKNSIKHLVVPGQLFVDMGFAYTGPIDGHDIGSMIKAFEYVKRNDGPVLIHLITQKGKGHSISEENPIRYHGVSPCQGTIGNKIPKRKTYTQVFGETMIDLAEKKKNIVAITAAMEEGTGLVEFSEKFPDRFFDCGICEEHGVTMAAGMAIGKLHPVVAIYSTFLQRGYDQIFHDICLQKLPVTFCLDRAGLVGEDGSTHHGVFDIAYLNHLPEITLMAPSSELELKEMLNLAVEKNSPNAIRYPRGEISEPGIVPIEKVLWGKSQKIQNGEDICILTVGSVTEMTIRACKKLKESIEIWNVRFIKPLDSDLLSRAEKFRKILIIEEGCIIGGFGSYFMTELYKKFPDFSGRIVLHGIEDSYVEHGCVEKLKEITRLDENGIKNIIENFLKENSK